MELNMKKYQVGVKIYNSFEVEANSEEEAEEIVRELSIESTLRDSDFNITYVDEIKDRNIVDEMVDDLIDLHYKTLKNLPDDRIICDDEHGNSL
jgi:ribosomal protein L20A (L18A)